MAVVFDGQPFTARQAYDAGWRPHDLHDAVHEAQLTRCFHGVYIDAGTIQDVRLRARMLALVTPRGAVVSDRSAAWMRGIDLSDFNEPVERVAISVLVASGRSPVRRAGVRSRVADLPEDDVELIEGIRVTTAARTAADLARLAPEGWSLAAVDAFLRAGVDRQAIADIVARYPGERGVARARSAVEWGDPGAESVMESWSRWRLLVVGFPRPRTQIPLLTEHGEVRIDLGYDDLAVGAEYDGRAYHSAEVGGRDHRRLAGIARRGWWLQTLGTAQVLGARPTAALEVGTLMMRRGWRPEPATARALEIMATSWHWNP